MTHLAAELPAPVSVKRSAVKWALLLAVWAVGIVVWGLYVAVLLALAAYFL